MTEHTTRFTTWGPVRGTCGHIHYTQRAAEQCIEQDQRGCTRQGGYSDRHVRAITTADALASFDVQTGPGSSL